MMDVTHDFEDLVLEEVTKMVCSTLVILFRSNDGGSLSLQLTCTSLDKTMAEKIDVTRQGVIGLNHQQTIQQS
jgi:hypothetical protein